MKKETKYKAFSKSVKEAAAGRDAIDGWPCCIYCGAPAPDYLSYSNAHFVGRGQGGLGVEENCLTLCPGCHMRYDQSEEREEMREFFGLYLAKKYPHWKPKNLFYRRR